MTELGTPQIDGERVFTGCVPGTGDQGTVEMKAVSPCPHVAFSLKK